MRAFAVVALLSTSALLQSLADAQTPAGTTATDAVRSEVVSIRTLAYPYALQAAQAALTACEMKHQKVAVVIVDSAGNTRMIMVGDGANPSLVDAARRKAYTAAQMRQNTADVQKALAANPHMLIPPNSNFLIASGGVPFYAGSQVVGGIGLDGADPVTADECAHAGVDKLDSSLQPSPPKKN